MDFKLFAFNNYFQVCKLFLSPLLVQFLQHFCRTRERRETVIFRPSEIRAHSIRWHKQIITRRKTGNYLFVQVKGWNGGIKPSSMKGKQQQKWRAEVSALISLGFMKQTLNFISMMSTALISGNTSAKNENAVIMYSPSCHSKPFFLFISGWNIPFTNNGKLQSGSGNKSSTFFMYFLLLLLCYNHYY